VSFIPLYENIVHFYRFSSYQDAPKYSAKLGDAKKALLYAEKALEMEKRCIGMDHVDCPEQLDIVLQLRYAARSPNIFNESEVEWYDMDQKGDHYNVT